MDSDKYQHAWQAYASQTRVTIDPDALLKEVQRSQGSFRATILLRDFREVGVALVMLPIWFYMGITMSLPWTWYLTVPTLLWLIGFILIDRKRHPQKPSEPGEPLLHSVKESLTQLEHQIWLLRNVFWWYLLPFVISISAFFLHTAWKTSNSWWEALGFALFLELILAVLYTPIYYLNQYAVRTQLEPRRQELLALLASLTDETTSEVSGEYPILTSAECAEVSPRRMLFAGVCFVAILLIGVPSIIYVAYRVDQYLDQDYPKVSPFAAVRWDEAQPEVKVDGEWVRLVLLNNIPASKIVAYSQETYEDMWQKRFEEDLVELLTRMGRPPQDTVTLTVQSLTSAEVRILRDVPMTTANRRAIRDAAQARERSEQQHQALHHAVPIEEVRSNAEPLAEALESIRATYKLPAIAAFVMRGGEVVERATVGTRSTKDDTPVTSSAQWHLGSNTQAMTATLTGMLVEEGLLQWDSTLGDILSEAVPDMDAGHRDTTLTMLLHHTGGITPNINWYSAPEDRVACVAGILSSAPKRDRGSYAYSNGGYVVAGAMIEVVTGRRWEELTRKKIFEPLGMTDSGFGAPSNTNSPWGHRSSVLRKTPMDPTTRGSDNAPVLGPAGTVHVTLEDYARFLTAHMEGAQGKDGIVSAETFATLHTPRPGGKYAKGWIVVSRGWAGGQALSHSGSNTMWYATAWLAPEKNTAFFAVTNAGGDKASVAVNKAIEALISRHLQPDDAPSR